MSITKKVKKNKRKIEKLEAAISRKKELIKLEEEQIKKLQKKCNHDFEDLDYPMCPLKECKKCGYLGGGI